MRKKHKLISLCLTVILIFTMAMPAFAGSKAKNKKKIEPPKLQCRAAVLYCVNTGEVLYEKGKTVEFPAGDTSKLMTAIIGLQKLSKDDEITVGKVSGGEDAPVQEGEKLTVYDLLHGVLMSGEDSAAQAIAAAVEAEGDNFTELMNSTATNIGCRHTVFAGPTGVSGEEDDPKDDCSGTTTVKDLVEIAKVTMADKTLGRIALTDSYMIKDKNSDLQRAVQRNSFHGEKGHQGIRYSIENVQSNGDLTSVIYTNRNGLEFIIAVNGDSDKVVKKDTLSLIEYGAKKVRGLSVIKKNQCAGKVRVKHGAKTGIKVYATSDGLAYLPKAASKSLVGKRLKADNLEAPVKKGDIVGNCEILVADEVTGVVPVYAGETVKVGWAPSYLGISNKVTVIICIVLVLFVSILIARCINKIRYKRKKKKIRAARIKRLAREQLRDEERIRKRYRI